MRRPIDLYPGQIDVTTDVSGFPDGMAQNDSSPSDTDGTPFEKEWINDVWGFFQNLLVVTGITPNDAPERAVPGSSQLVEAIKTLIRTLINAMLESAAVAFSGDVTAHTVTTTGNLSSEAGLAVQTNAVIGEDLTVEVDATVERDLLVGRNAAITGNATVTGNGLFNALLAVGSTGQFILPNVIAGPATGGPLSVLNSLVYWGADVHPSTLQSFSLPNPAVVPTGSFIICCNYNSGATGNVKITGGATGDVTIDNAFVLFVRMPSGVWRLIMLG